MSQLKSEKTNQEALYNAAMRGDFVAVKKLHSQGVNITGQKPIFIAAFRGKTDVAMYLRAHGASAGNPFDQILDRMIKQKKKFNLIKSEFIDMFEEGVPIPQLPELKPNMGPADYHNVLAEMTIMLNEKKLKN